MRIGEHMNPRDLDGWNGEDFNVLEPGGLSLTFTYDSAGNRTQVQDSLGGTTTSTFDVLNRNDDRTFSGSGQPTLRIRKASDGYGRLGSISRYTTGSLVATLHLSCTQRPAWPAWPPWPKRCCPFPQCLLYHRQLEEIA